jgi:hypothetical protein
MLALTVAARCEREKAIWRRARACSLVLAVPLTARLAELLTEPAAELLTARPAGASAERSCELRVARLGLTRAADAVSGS